MHDGAELSVEAMAEAFFAVLDLTRTPLSLVRAVGLDTPGPASAEGVVSSRGSTIWHSKPFSRKYCSNSRNSTTVGTSSLQSRATAGLIGTTFVFCLPGSRGACRDAWEGILTHQLDYRHKPCNFVDLIPRLDER